MGILLKQILFQSPTSSGTQNVTISGFGTPTAAIVIGIKSANGSAESLGTAYDGASFNIGFFDGTNNRVAATEGLHGAAVDDGARSMVEGVIDQVVTSPDPILSIATATAAFIADGVQLTWTGTPEAHTYLLILIKGTQSVSVGDHIGAASKSLGFRPDIIFAVTPGIEYPQRISASLLSLGCIVDDGSNTERAIIMGCTDGDTPTRCTLTTRTDKSIGQVYNGSLNWSGNITIENDGFATSTLDVDEMIFLAVELAAGDQCALGTYATPTATGNAATTGIGFEPDALIVALSNATALNVVSASSVYGFGVGISDGTDEYFFGEAEQDAIATSNTQSKATNSLIDLPDHNGNQLCVGTLGSFDADGFTVNYTAASGSARYGWYLAIRAVPAGPPVEVIRYVDPNATGGAQNGTSWTDAYLSINAWNLAEAKSIVTANEWHHVYCRVTGKKSSDPVAVVMSASWVTDTTHYIKIEAESTNRAAKTGITALYKLAPTDAAGGAFQTTIGNIWLDGLQLQNLYSAVITASIISISGTTGFFYVSNCRFHKTGSGNRRAIDVNSAIDLKVWNTIAFNTFAFVDCNALGTAEIYNCIGRGVNVNGITFPAAYTSAKVKNCAVFDNNNDIVDLKGAAVIDYCATDDGDGTNAVSPSGGSWANEFLDYPINGDFTIIDGGNLYKGGITDPGAGLYSTDIDGDLYYNPWSIGVDDGTYVPPVGIGCIAFGSGVQAGITFGSGVQAGITFGTGVQAGITFGEGACQ